MTFGQAAGETFRSTHDGDTTYASHDAENTL